MVTRERAEFVFDTDAPATNAMLVVQQRIQRLDGDRVWCIALAVGFLDNDFELARKFVGVDDRARVRVELNVQSLQKCGRRQHRVVAGVIVDRVRVEIAAIGFRLARDLPHTARRRPLEEHVLEHVRDPDDVIRLVEVSGFHMSDDCDNGG